MLMQHVMFHLISMLFQLRKPDVAAPGVSILAAYPPLDKDHKAGYALLSGTSMACPHVSGIVALIKFEHPNWSLAAIRSTLVTIGQSLLIQLVSCGPQPILMVW